MRPDLDDLATILALLAIPLLLLPKQDWGSITERFLATARGDRCHVFGPASGREPLSSDFIERWLQMMRRELQRALQVGLPLHMLALSVEVRGARRRRAHEEEWRRSAAGLLFEHLSGNMTELELHERLRERGLRQPAGKLRWEPTPTFTMPPMEWRLDWERHLESLRDEEQPASEPTQSLAVMLPSPLRETGSAFELEIQTLGGLSIRSNGRDLAPGLVHRPALALPWLYLMVREVLRPGDRIMRAVLGDILFPRVDPEQQRRKLRGRLHELCNDLPEPLAGRIEIDSDYVGFGLSGCDVDVRRVQGLVEQIARQDGPLSDELLDQVTEGVRASRAEFLPGWEEIERRAIGAASGAEEAVFDVRNQVVAAYVSLVSAAATAHLTRRRPELAVADLEEALRRRPERHDLARLLAESYRQAGQRGRAASLRDEYGFEEDPPLL
jgi:hypothetical protein